jgi:arylsulfatase I/J
MVMQMDFAVGKIITSLKDTGLYENTVIFVSADNGGILPGGYNWPYRGQKATLWEGGMRAIGFVHPPLLPAEKRGHEYHGLVHVSDWFPTILGLSTNGTRVPLELELDGYDVWDAITTNTNSPRTELLHNIDVFGGVGVSGFGNAALRVGELKLIVGKPSGGNFSDDHYIPPGCDVCVKPKTPISPHCAEDTNATYVWLFNISADPFELCNLAGR